MFLKNTKIFNERSVANSLSIITQGIDFVGEINTEGDIHIDGKMNGVIRANEVVIGPHGNFEGEIVSNTLIITGYAKGKFTIKNLHIKREGLLQGKAKYELIVVESGGKIQGELGVVKPAKQLLKNKDNKEKENGANQNTNASSK
mgnify:CR=1 FL=1